ncbi:Uma2 family endonuclease [Azospirillum sp.]|uniref:Uma2 family endonuclease n=1 Tax=Azospirillum sp. TaxID=34012 RepID=UPI003D72C1A0
MAEPISTPMTIDTFIPWAEQIPDIRYELVHGKPRAKPLNTVGHGLIVGNLIGELGGRLHKPFRGLMGCGVRFDDRDECLYSPDFTVTGTPYDPHAYWVRLPVLIVEVLSESTATHDRGTKVPDYMRIPSVQEILLVDSRAPRVQLWRRDGTRWIVEDFADTATLPLASVGVDLPIPALYEGVAL